MTTLHWTFTNGHKWRKDFATEQQAMDYVYEMHMLADNNQISQVCLDSGTVIIWLKEKATA
jgi:hypothetical protein